MTNAARAHPLDLERRLLQAAFILAGFVPVTAGLSGVLIGPSFIDGTLGSPSVDSHTRYLSGLLLAIGLAFWSFVPRIEQETSRVRLLTALVAVGGLARLVSLIAVGAPSQGMLGGLVMELVVTPLLCLWQSRIARARP